MSLFEHVAKSQSAMTDNKKRTANQLRNKFSIIRREFSFLKRLNSSLFDQNNRLRFEAIFDYPNELESFILRRYELVKSKTRVNKSKKRCDSSDKSFEDRLDATDERRSTVILILF